MSCTFSFENCNISCGIVGTNFISDMFCEAAEKVGIKISALYSRNYDTGISFADKHNIENVFTDFDLFCKSSVFDFAYVASPNFLHCKQSLELLSCKKHVLCEKPVATKLSQFLQMRKCAKENGVILLEAMRPMYDIAFDIIQDEIKKIGKIRKAQFNFCQYSSRYDKFKEGTILNAFNPALENCALFDIGTYCIHMCLKFFGKPEKILSHSVFLNNGFEGQGECILSYGDMLANICYSKISQSHTPSYILGENGCVCFGQDLPKINEIVVFENSGEKHIKEFCAVPNNMIYELYAFVNMILSGKQDEYSLDISQMKVEICDEIIAQSGISLC